MPTLEITTQLGCALACRFCPQDRLVKSYPRSDPRRLSLADFTRVVAKLPQHIRIDFSGMSEPWLNPDATDMVTHAFEQMRDVAIYTTLQGLSPDAAASLIDRFGARISSETPWVIHLPDAEGNMTGWKCSPAYRATLDRFIAFQRDRMPAGLSFMTMSADGAVAQPIRDLLPEPLAPFQGISRVENLDRADFAPAALLRPIRHNGAVLCRSTPFFDHNAMLPNGDVLLCCMDYGRAHVLGNLLRQSWEEIHASAAMGSVRVQAMTPTDTDDLICRRCHNAACLSKGSDTHWHLSGSTMWTDPSPKVSVAGPATPSPRSRQRLGALLGRALHLQPAAEPPV